MHQARAVTGADTVGSRGDDRRQLLVEHRRRHIGVLHRERASEAATFLGIGKIEELDPGDGAKQPRRGISDAQKPQRVTRRVVRDRALVCRTDILDTQDTGEELRELPRSCRHAAVVPLEQPGYVLSHLRRARAGRGHHGVIRREDLDEPAGKQRRLGRIPRVRVHLAATRLLSRKHDLDPEPLEHRHRRPADLRKQRVGETRDEQGHTIDHRSISL